jgi:diguanylate cyclase (GGDEF)-like protein
VDEKRLSVLVVEGTGVDALALRDALGKQVPRARVDLCRTAVDALDRLERSALGSAEAVVYDAAIVNVGNCGMAPAPFVSQLTEIIPGTPIIALVPAGQGDAGKAALRSGADEAIAFGSCVAEHAALVVRLVVEKRQLVREIDRQRTQLTELASRDDLTGLANRRRFNEALENEVERANRFHRPLTLVLFDLDALKLINDTYGHPVGDAAVRHIGTCLRTEIRRFEVAARVGGDEFAVLLVDTNFDQGRVVAEKLRRRIAAASVGPVGQVTISAGLASLPAHAESASELVRIADEALYEAKHQGRNRVVLSRKVRRERDQGRNRVVLSRKVRRERDGERHRVRFKLLVAGRNNRGEAFTEETETELISRRGARIVSSHTVATGEQVELRTPFHGRPLVAQITSCYRGVDNRWHVGFKLVDPPRWSG